MVKMGNNILGLLLGAAKASAKGQQPGIVGKADPGEALFGDVLGLFISNKAGKLVPAFANTGLVGRFAGTKKVTGLPVLCKDTISTPVPHGAVNIDKAGLNPRQSGAVNIDKAGLNPRQSGAVRTDTRSASVLWPLKSAVAHQNPAGLTICRSVPIEPGLYEILSARVVDGKLELVVRAEGKTSQPIRLSLPLGLLKALQNQSGAVAASRPNRKGTSAGRVQLQPTLAGAPKFDELVARLNLKSIEIAPDVKEGVQNSIKNSVQVKIIAGDAGNEIVLRAKLAKHEIKATVEEKPTGNSKARKVPNKSSKPILTKAKADQTGAGFRDDSRQDAPSRVLSNTLVTEMKAHRWGKQFDLVDQWSRMESAEQSHESRGAAGFDFEKLGMSIRMSGGRLSMPSARFQLPDNIGQMLKPNGESIMLRIEPDHLGPARLHLTMRGDMLSARLVVESVQAYVTVEGSLDKLTEQLSRAGIEIDRIEVAIEGGEARSQFFDRRPIWNRGSRFRSHIKDDNHSVEGVTPMLAVPVRSVEYVNQHGVNLLA